LRQGLAVADGTGKRLVLATANRRERRPALYSIAPGGEDSLKEERAAALRGIGR
jgi:hypothetical protein